MSKQKEFIKTYEIIKKIDKIIKNQKKKYKFKKRKKIKNINNKNIINPKFRIIIRKNIFNAHWENIFAIILLFIFFICITKEVKFRKIISSISEITITINGTGNQNILSNDAYTKDNKNFNFNKIPDRISINGGVSQNCTDKIVNNLSSEINNITLIWDENLIDCNLMFSGLYNIIYIDLSNFDSSEITGMFGMFKDCSSLTSVNFGNFDTSKVTDMCSMFGGCTLLTSINLSSFNTENVVDLSYMFANCISLILIDLSNFNTPKMKYIGGIFYNCRALKNINLNNLNTSNTEFMDKMFYECKNLSSIDIRNFDASKVIDMSLMFSGCNSLTSIDLSNFDAKSVKWMNDIFSGCSKLEILNLTNFKTASVEKMNNMFRDCESLTSLDLSSFNTENISDISSMFFGCKLLSSIDLSNFNTPNLKYIGSMLYNCNSLKYINIDNFNTSQVEYMDRMFFGCKSLTTLDISNFNTSSVLDMCFLFRDCNSLTSINISNFNTSLVKDMKFMFYGCNSLKTLDLRNLNTSKVTNMSSMFYGCSSLTTLNLINFETSYISDMGRMFYNCISLLSLDLNSFDTSNVYNMNHMFYNCSSLIFLNLNNFNTSKVSKFDSIFSYCNESLIYCINLETVKLFSSKLINITNNNCADICFMDSHKLIVEERKCIIICDDENNMFEYNGKCYESCPNGTYFSLNNNYLCEDILCEHYYNYEHTECIDSIPEGYYLNDSIRKTIEKCDIKCKACTNESIINNLCVSCNNKEKYYSKFNTNSNNNLFTDCYNIEQFGYYLDYINNIFMPCFTEIINQDNNNKICEECYNEISINYLKCFEICDYNYDKCISKDIKYISKDVNIININSNNKAYSYEINSDINELKKLFKNLTFIDISTEIKIFLINEFNLDKEKDKIYVLMNQYSNNYSISKSATNYYNYRFILENGTELNLTNINEDYYINVYVPIKDLDLAHFNYSLLFAEQGYDIYDKNSNFYNDICTPAYINDNDITLKDRKKDIYPNNVTLCKDNCYYNDTDREGKRIICKCNLNNNISEIKEDDDFLKENEDNNFMSYLLDKVNYKIFKCKKLLFNFGNLKNNFSFYSILSILFIILIFNLSFYCLEIPKIKKLIFKEDPPNREVKEEKKRSKNKNKRKKHNKRNIISNPVKKNKKKKKRINISKTNTIKFSKILKAKRAKSSKFININLGLKIINKNKNILKTKENEKEK